jgi:hypothetical protein
LNFECKKSNHSTYNVPQEGFKPTILFLGKKANMADEQCENQTTGDSFLHLTQIFPYRGAALGTNKISMVFLFYLE